jgi:hypothetical protein
MSPDELRELGEDIVTNGVTSPIALWRADPKSPLYLLDGRNRLDAIEMVTGRPVEVGAPSIMAGEFLAIDGVTELDGRKVDPWAYAVSANIHRRHLTAEQKREVMAALIKAQPEKPDLQIAKAVKVSPTTVGTVRREMEAKGDVSKLETRTDTKGRQQPARKARPPKEKLKSEPVEPTAAARGDISATSTSEVNQLHARVRELENEKRRLEIKVVGLESEIEDLKAENDGLRAKLEAAPKVAAASSNSNGSAALGDVLDEAFSRLEVLASECRETVESLAERFGETTRVQNLDEAADVLEDLNNNKPDVSAELAAIKIDLPKRRKPRSYSDRRDAVSSILAACMGALRGVDQSDPLHQGAHDLYGKLQDASSDIDNCAFQ